MALRARRNRTILIVSRCQRDDVLRNRKKEFTDVWGHCSDSCCTGKGLRVALESGPLEYSRNDSASLILRQHIYALDTTVSTNPD